MKFWFPFLFFITLHFLLWLCEGPDKDAELLSGSLFTAYDTAPIQSKGKWENSYSICAL